MQAAPLFYQGILAKGWSTDFKVMISTTFYGS